MNDTKVLMAKDDFSEVIKPVAILSNRRLTQEEFDLYYSILGELNKELLKKAVNMVVLKDEYAKTRIAAPALFIKMYNIVWEESFKPAVGTLIQAITEVGPSRIPEISNPLLNAYVNWYGGWERVCHIGISDLYANIPKFLSERS